MNKFLMMSAAAVMGTMAVAASEPASAGTFVTTVSILDAAGTFAYCDTFAVYSQTGNKYNAVHNFSACGFSPAWIPNAGEYGKAAPKHISLASIEYPVYYGEDVQLVWDFDLPLNKTKKGKPVSKWFVYGNSNGTTQFLINSGLQTNVAAGGRLPQKKESGAQKLASLLKAK
jgi:hypothetical protein